MTLACLDTKVSSPVQYALTLLSNQHMDETVVKIKAPVYAVRAAGSVFVCIKVSFSLVPSVVFFVSFFRLGSIYSPAGRNDGKTCLSSTEHTLTTARKKPAAVCSAVLSAVFKTGLFLFPWRSGCQTVPGF